MKDIHRKIELVANISIISVALLLGYIGVKRFLVPGSGAKTGNLIRVGAKLPLADHNWSGSAEHLVLVLQTRCHFCSESSQFYQRLLEQSADPQKLDVIAVLPESTNESTQYLDKLGLHITQVVQMDLSSVGVLATPTVLLVNSDGAVTGLWTGKLPPDKEAEVLNQIKANCGC